MIQHHIQPHEATAIITNFNREVGLFVKQTKWSDMKPHELKDIQFLTTTLVQLGKFYDNQKNGSLLGGIMKDFGWRKAFGQNGTLWYGISFNTH